MPPIDRKEESRRYREGARPTGVYRVRNSEAGLTLIGVSPDVPAMLNRQRFQLQMGSHPNKALQRDFERLGETAFEFEELDLLEPAEDAEPSGLKDELAELELMWREKLSSAGERFYNVKPGSLA